MWSVQMKDVFRSHPLKKLSIIIIIIFFWIYSYRSLATLTVDDDDDFLELITPYVEEACRDTKTGHVTPTSITRYFKRQELVCVHLFNID